MSTDLVLVDDPAPAVRRVTLNRPKKRNALNHEMRGGILDALEEADRDPSVRVMIVRGAGSCFSSGYELGDGNEGQELPWYTPGGDGHWPRHVTAGWMRIWEFGKPVIAQVHGIATAAGCQLVATCDLAVAAEDTRFGVNGVNIGLFCSTPMVALSRNIPRKQAFEMLTTGEFIDAARARELGLINHIAPPDELATQTTALAQQIADKLGTAVKIGKQAFYAQLAMPVAQAYVYTGDVMVENMLNPDTAEGIAAFLEKRTPEWDQ